MCQILVVVTVKDEKGLIIIKGLVCYLKIKIINSIHTLILYNRYSINLGSSWLIMNALEFCNITGFINI